MFLWVAEPAGKRVDRIDIYKVEEIGELRACEDLEGERHFSKMCFDGMYIWLTDYTGTEEFPEHGVIHRLLV